MPNAKPHGSGAGRWRKLQSVFLSNLKDARSILLLVRTQCADFLEESFEARRGDDTHKTTGRLAEVAVGVGIPRGAKIVAPFCATNVFPPTVHSYSPSRIWKVSCSR